MRNDSMIYAWAPSMLAVVLVSSGCSGSGENDDESSTLTPYPTPVLSSISDLGITATAEYNSITLLSAAPALDIVCTHPEHTEEIRSTSITETGEGWQYVLYGAQAGTTYNCSAVGYAGSVSVTTVQMKTELQSSLFTPFNPSQCPAWYAGSYQQFNYNLMAVYSATVVMDCLGNVRWFLEHNDPNTFTTPQLVGMPVKELFLADNGDGRPGFIGLNGQAGVTVSEEKVCEHDYGFHDTHVAKLTQDGYIIATKLGKRMVDDPSGTGEQVPSYFVSLFGIYEAATGNLVGHWCSEEQGFSEEDPKPAAEGTMKWDNPTTDYLHANAAQPEYDADGRIVGVYISLKNQSQILKYSVTSDWKFTLEWAMGPGGDFALYDISGQQLDEGKWFSHQHGFEFRDGLLSMNDNGTDRDEWGGQNYSRSLVLEVDEQNRTATIIATWSPDLDWEWDIYGSLYFVDDTMQYVLASAPRSYPGSGSLPQSGWFYLELPDPATELINMNEVSGLLLASPSASSYSVVPFDPAIFQITLLK